MGSGKNTTLYSTLKCFAGKAVNLSTIEDPIEMLIAGFNQSQIDTAIVFNFAGVTHALMRQDTDNVMVDKIRNAETAHLALQAAVNEHLVLFT